MASIPTNSVALVTGAAQGIGRAIAQRLAEDGHNIVLNDIADSTDKLEAAADELRTTGRTVTIAVGDISSAEEVAAMFAKIVADQGSLNVLVANAGVAGMVALLDMEVDEWDRVLSINARGTFLCIQAAARQMVKQGGGGRILACSSIVGFRATPMLAHYSATKWAVRGLVQAAAQELAVHKITVNAYCPGLVDTGLLDATITSVAQAQNISENEAKANLLKTITLGRFEKPSEVAGLVSFLASPDADYITGQSILVDGGVQFS